MTTAPGVLDRLRRSLPRGLELPSDVWNRRHHYITLLLFAQGAALAFFAIVRGYGVLHSLMEVSIVVAAGVVALRRNHGRRLKAGAATFGLITTSALLVHFSGGKIEAHFHFFVMLSVISLYQDWSTYLLALGYVVVHHGTMGVFQPTSVYDHASAWANPWKWAAIHGAFVLAASVANIVAWRLNEDALTDQRKAEADLRSALSLVTATLESTADGILVVDASGKISSLNQRFAEMWQIPADVLAAGDDAVALQFVTEQLVDPGAFIAKVRELYSLPDAESHDMLFFKDGRVFERYSQPQRVGGLGVGRVWSFRDVTERSRLDELKNAFLSAVSHELRTPLTAVLGYAVTLERADSTLNESERRSLLRRLTATAKKLERLLVDTLDLDRLSRGILEPNRTRVELAALINRVVSEGDLPLDRKIEIDAQPVTADVDAAKVERIVENLLLNACRHTPPGTPVWIHLRAENGTALIAVEDDGPGVPSEFRESIFESFRQGPGIATHSPGVGLGLSLVARFAELHGGRAWVEDRRGGGASFRVCLPLHDPKAVEGSAYNEALPNALHG